jgi:DNA sulfur modification protein DndD
MKNFMRYKGVNTIEFSCDAKKNVTVVLGDNTVGKTTIAQAFRWGLYGAVQTERGKKQEDYQLLNNDVLAMMDANSHASVSVEIVAVDEEKQYDICREVSYARQYPKMLDKEIYKKLRLEISEKDDPNVKVSIEDYDQINEVINELFPRNLSHYFLFDGERWRDVTVDGVRENIKESVHILTGLSAYQKAIWHLKDMGSNSVIKKFRSKISGSGSIYDQLNQDYQRMEREIAHCNDKIETININLQHYEEKIQEVEQYLEANRDTEALQARYKQLQVVKRTQAERNEANYKNLVNEFSDKAYMIFAQPMIESALKMVKSVAGERRDIPYMHQSSIDYIIKTGTCICGTKLSPNSKEMMCLMEQRNYLPPADIGSLLGDFEKTSTRWQNRISGVAEELKSEAKKIDECVREFEETSNQLAAIERRMDEQIDFAEKRGQLKQYQRESQDLSREKGELEGKIAEYKHRMHSIEDEMQHQEAKNVENEKWRKRVDLAEALYTRLSNDFSEKENKTFLELNREIQENFSKMFNAKDKKIQLTEQYEIQMLYKTDIGFREEKNLSEGEKVARNFAFIVTIMDYSRRMKAEKMSTNEQGDTLPIVLDGPFSKLGDENIRLIAQVLPGVSEQVILFMLDKDWKYTGLDEYVGSAYRICKEADEAYATIKQAESL